MKTIDVDGNIINPNSIDYIATVDLMRRLLGNPNPFFEVSVKGRVFTVIGEQLENNGDMTEINKIRQSIVTQMENAKP